MGCPPAHRARPCVTRIGRNARRPPDISRQWVAEVSLARACALQAPAFGYPSPHSPSLFLLVPDTLGRLPLVCNASSDSRSHLWKARSSLGLTQLGSPMNSVCRFSRLTGSWWALVSSPTTCSRPSLACFSDVWPKARMASIKVRLLSVGSPMISITSSSPLHYLSNSVGYEAVICNSASKPRGSLETTLARSSRWGAGVFGRLAAPSRTSSGGPWGPTGMLRSSSASLLVDAREAQLGMPLLV